MTPRTLKILFAASLLINVFLVAGLIGGAAWWHGRHGGERGFGTIQIVGAELPGDERRAFREQLRDARQSLRPVMQQSRQARLDAATLLRAPVVDQAALGAALGRARAADEIVRTQLEARAIAFLATLPQADRARLAEGLERRSTRGGR